MVIQSIKVSAHIRFLLGSLSKNPTSLSPCLDEIMVPHLSSWNWWLPVQYSQGNLLPFIHGPFPLGTLQPRVSWEGRDGPAVSGI